MSVANIQLIFKNQNYIEKNISIFIQEKKSIKAIAVIFQDFPRFKILESLSSYLSNHNHPFLLNSTNTITTDKIIIPSEKM